MIRHNGAREVEWWKVRVSRACPVPLLTCRVEAGFPSPADDSIEEGLDLNDYVIQHPAATFFVRVAGHSMTGAGIHPGDILVVDRALEPQHGRVVIAVVEGELTVKRIHKSRKRVVLLPDNPDYPPLPLDPDGEFSIWGVVTYVIHAL
ncbi:MAG: translesion error-prone DNA polymerase V autoproteolytic subunit [Synechococcales cyanobacterium]